MIRKTAFLAGALLFCSVSFAQDPDLILSVGSATGDASGVSSAVSFDNTGASDVDGWSYGVCSDIAVVSLDSATDSALVSTINNGNPPGFGSTTSAPEGATQGVVIDLFGIQKLAPGTGYVFLDLAYSVVTAPAAGDPAITTDVVICNTLGTPPVADVIVIAGASITPTEVPGTFTIEGAPPPGSFEYFTTGGAITVSGTAVEANTVTVGFGIRDLDDAMNGSDDVQGFSMGNANTGGFLTAASVAPVGQLAGLNGGMGPAFFTENIAPAGGPGWTVGVVNNLMGGVFLNLPSSGEVLVEVTYDVDNSSLVMDPCVDQVVTESLTYDSNLGMPPVANVVVVDGASIDPAGLFSGNVDITVQCIIDVPFIRGDCNDDGTVNIADVVANIGAFVGGFSFSAGCPAACDANNDGLNDLSDSIYIAAYRFQNGPPPSAPFPDCGTDAGVATNLNCVYNSCP